MDRIICIAGPTASGKTALAVSLAQRLNGEVISCDSMQVYRGMDVGTAKPTPDERGGVPHHMIDIAEPGEPMSVGKFADLAAPVLANVLARGKTAILAGGTGLYMDALIRGNDFPPVPATGRRQALETRLAVEGPEPLRRELLQVDPESAARIPAGDQRRLIRALEVYEETGHTITWHNRQSRLLPPLYRPLWIGLDFADRAALYHRINLRVDRMAEQGLLEEVRRLLEQGVPASATAMQAIGYKEPLAALRGEITVEQALEQVKQSSRRYAKRQLTWFRRNPEMHWLLQPEQPDPADTLTRALAMVPFAAGEKTP